jgi:hypothetical protein
MTAPVRADHRPRAFDVNRISQFLDNPAYAGLVVHKGEIVGPGNWPRYIEPEDFHRLRQERRARAHVTKRKVGRPPLGYLLAEVAVCGVCLGPCRVETSREDTSSGTRRRRYVCTAHRDHHRKSAEWCPAVPYDAEEADKLVLSGIDTLLMDADALSGQLSAGRAAEVERMGQVAEEARKEASTADRVVAKAQARYARALAEDDDEVAEITLSVVQAKREEAKRARDRLNAALDALSADSPADDGDVLGRVWEALSGSVDGAQGDIRKLNAALREWFDEFGLHRTADGLEVVPVMSAQAIARLLRQNLPPAARVEVNGDGTLTMRAGDHVIELEGNASTVLGGKASRPK